MKYEKIIEENKIWYNKQCEFYKTGLNRHKYFKKSLWKPQNCSK